MKRYSLFKFSIVIALLMCNAVYLQPISAQSNAGFTICLTPFDFNKGASTAQKPYRIDFRDNIASGFIFPDDATAVVYSSIPISVWLYKVTPDAATGSYKLGERVANITARQALPTGKACGDTAPLTHSSIAAPVNADLAMVIQTKADESAPKLAVLGAATIQVATPTPPNNNVARVQFQFLQLEATMNASVTFSIPQMTPGTAMRAIANKSFQVRQTLATNVEGGSITADSFAFMLSQYKGKELDLVSEFRNAKSSVFPAYSIDPSKLKSEGGVITLQLEQAPVTPRLNVRQKVQSWTGVKVDYFVPGRVNAPLGALTSGVVAEISRIDDKGQLFVKVPGREDEVQIVDSWLLTVVP